MAIGHVMTIDLCTSQVVQPVPTVRRRTRTTALNASRAVRAATSSKRHAPRRADCAVRTHVLRLREAVLLHTNRAASLLSLSRTHTLSRSHSLTLTLSLTLLLPGMHGSRTRMGQPKGSHTMRPQASSSTPLRYPQLLLSPTQNRPRPQLQLQ